MATCLIMGQPGAGKTSLAVERVMLPYFAQDPKLFDPGSSEPGNGIIVTNVPVNRDRWAEEFGETSMSRLITFPEFIVDPETGEERRPFTVWSDFEPLLELRDEHGRAPLFVIDEAHEVIPKGLRFLVDKNTGKRLDTFPNKLLLLFTRQRHYLASFALITQDPFSMAPDILKQVHSSLYVENAEMKGAKHAYTLKVWNKAPPRNFQTVPFAKCDDGQMKPRSYNRNTQSFFISNSKNNLGSSGRALEGRYMHSRSIWKRPIVLAMIPAAIAVLYFGGNVLSFGQNDDPKVKPASIAQVAKSPNQRAAPIAPTKPIEFDQTDVIADLGAIERETIAADQRKDESVYYTRLYASYASLDGRNGPIVVTQYPWASSPFFAHLSDYAAFWGYSVQSAECGWTLTRSDNVRHFYDPQCLGVRHHESIVAAAVSSTSSSAGLGSVDGGATKSGSVAPGNVTGGAS